VLFELVLLALDEDLLEGAALEIELELGAILEAGLLDAITLLIIELLATELELFSDELVAGAELLITAELIATEDLLELEIIALDDALEETGVVLDATDEVVAPHKLPFTLGAPAVPLA
jgi:hypothetical protein